MKTRLIPVLGAERAARVHQWLLERTLDIAETWQERYPAVVELHHTGTAIECAAQCLGSRSFVCRDQSGGSLGDRLAHAVATAFADQTQRLVIVGTDCPDLSAEILTMAFEALAQADVVIGPALDGGYYLIGLRRPDPALFHGIDWGTDRVLAQTLSRCRELGFRVKQLIPLSDIDVPEDLIVCRKFGMPCSDVLPNMQPGLISVVVPTRNEEQNIEQALRPIFDLPGIEIVVADGGSTDRTVEIARQFTETVIVVPPGRGRQMNAGAALARGEVLLFLHADSQLPADFQQHVSSVLGGGAVAGAFPLLIDDRHVGLRWIELAANCRSRFLQLPYGDQGLFLRAETFYRLGGFPHWPLMEDYELCRRIRRHGRIGLASSAIRTSPRRWLKLGLWQTTLINQLCLAGFHLGVSPERLAAWYAAGSRRNSA